MSVGYDTFEERDEWRRHEEPAPLPSDDRGRSSCRRGRGREESQERSNRADNDSNRKKRKYEPIAQPKKVRPSRKEERWGKNDDDPVIVYHDHALATRNHAYRNDVGNWHRNAAMDCRDKVRWAEDELKTIFKELATTMRRLPEVIGVMNSVIQRFDEIRVIVEGEGTRPTNSVAGSGRSNARHCDTVISCVQKNNTCMGLSFMV